MTTYLVTWEIEVDAESAREAAEIARAIQQDPENQGLVFDVAGDGDEVVIDLMEIGDDWPADSPV